MLCCSVLLCFFFFFFFFNDTATTEIYTLSLHDALPVSSTTPVRTRTGWTTSLAANVHTATSPTPTRQPTGAPRAMEAVRGRRQYGGRPRCSLLSGDQY